MRTARRLPAPVRARALLASAAPLALAALAALGPALAPAPRPAATACADQTPDVRLPWNPADDAKGGDWAYYQVRDPDKPEERLPGERYVVAMTDEAMAVLVDSKNEPYKYLRGEKGYSARAWLEGFFGEVRQGKMGDVESISVSPDGVDLGGKHYDCARVEASLATPVSEGGKDVMRSVLKMWIARGVHGSGLVRAEAEVHLFNQVHRGIFELEAHGTKDDKQPSRNPADAPKPATGTAGTAGTAAPAPAGTTGTAAPAAPR